MKYRLHVIGIPHTKTNLDYTTCAFTQKVYKFCKMMHDRGHYVINYGVEGSNPECDENVSVVPDEIFQKVYGNRDAKKFYDTSQNNECYATFYKNTIKEISKRKQPGDIALAFWGCGIQPIIYAHRDMIWVHPGIGYDSPLEEGIEFRVFESNALRSEYYGHLGVCYWRQTDRVIPNYFDSNDFEYKDESQKEDYFLYLGRVYDTKGLNIILNVVKQTGIKLKVAGQLADQYLDENFKWPENVEYVGLADVEKRKKLMSNAKGSFLMARYLEPFGGVQIENFLSGTPMITTNAGCYPETNPNGLTGYCCNNLKETIDAVEKIKRGEIKSVDCRKWGERYLLNNIAPQFESFFEDCIRMHNGDDIYKSLLEDKQKKHIACFGDCGWAVGRIYNFLKKYIDKNKYVVDLYEWKHYENFVRLFLDGNYNKYDCIIVQNTIKEDYKKVNINSFDWNQIDDKTIAVSHTYPDYEEPINYWWKHNYALGKYNVDEHEKVSDKKFGLLYSGYDSDLFYKVREVKEIHSIGFCGNPNVAEQRWLDVKRPWMLDEIAKNTNCVVNNVYGKDISNGYHIYDDIDMYVCTSILEAGPLGVLECAACGIPVISTNVGYVKELNSIKKFETVEEASEIINYFNEHPDELLEYTETLRKEVEEKFSCKNVIKYWEDAIENVTYK